MTPPSTSISLESLLAERSWLRALSVSLVGASDADDLAQDAVLVALERQRGGGASQDAPVLSAKGWLAGITYRLAMSRRRREGSARGHEYMYGVDARVEGRLDARPGVDELAERAELEGEVVAELLRLPEPQRSVLLLRFQGGRSGAEIARELGRPDGTVRRQLKTGLDQLRQRMDDRRGGRTAWAPLLIGLPAARSAAVGTAGAATGTAALIPLLTLSMKKLLLAVAVLLAATAWWTRALWLEQPDSAGAAAPLVMVDEPRALIEALDGMVEPGAVAQGAREVGPSSAMALPAAPPTPEAVSYRILDSRGAGIQVERAVLVLDEVTVELEAAGDGLVSIGADSPDLAGALERREGVLAVSRTNAWPEVFAVPVELGVHDVLWPSGRDLEGQLLETGREPGEAITMTLVRDIGWSGAEELERLDEARAAFPVRVRADETGRFTLRDLPAGWRGWLRHRRAWRFVPASADSETFQVGETAQLRLSVERMPRIVGRLVSADGGEDTAQVTIGISEIQADGGSSWHSVATDADGRFEWFPRLTTTSVTLQLGRDERFRARELADLVLPAGGQLDVGDVAVESAGSLKVRVLDPEGLPAASALVRESIPGPARPWATDGDGHATLRVKTAGTVEVLVTAEGWARSRFQVMDSGEGRTHELRLEPALHAELTVQNRGGSPLPGVEVTFVPIAGLAADALDDGGWYASVVRGGQVSQGTHVDGRNRFSAVSGEDGRIELTGLPRALQLQCGFQDNRWEWIAPPLTISADEHGNWRGELLETRASAPVIQGHVTTLEGEPIEGARVRLGSHDDFMTDASGSFEAECEPGTEKVLLTVSAPAFATQFRMLEGPDELGSTVDIQLRPERALSVRVIDAEGQPVRDVQLMLWSTVVSAGRQRVDFKNGLPERPYRVAGVPAGELELEITRDGATYRHRVGAAEGDVRVVLEAPGEVTVDWSAIDALVEGIALRLPDESGTFGPGPPTSAERAASWRLTSEDKELRRKTLPAVPGRYQVLLGSRTAIVGMVEVEVLSGASTTIVITQ